MLQIIGAGLPRTGTSSLKAALERLGFGPCHHMFELLRDPEQASRWRSLATGAPADWDRLLGGYRSALDWPAAHFWRELAHAHPDAKVILTVRDAHRWYASARDTFLRGLSDQPDQEEIPEALQAIATLQPLLHRIGEQTFGPGMPDEDQAVQAFHRHTAEVQRSLPADRLLVFEVSQGWQPLCDFLGRQPPGDEPFPHLNDTETIQRMFQHAATEDRLVTPFDHLT